MHDIISDILDWDEAHKAYLTGEGATGERYGQRLEAADLMAEIEGRWQHLPGGFRTERKRIKIHIQAVAEAAPLMSSEDLCWLAIAAASAWETRQPPQALVNLTWTQPDLNWWEPAVHDEFRRILEFWFERGVAGFRIDVAPGLYKDAELRDNPPLGDGGPMDGAFGLRFVYNTNRPQTHAVYRDWRKIAESYSPARLLLGETWVPDAERLAAYYGNHDELQLGFNFPFAFASFDPDRLAQIVEWTLAALPPGACPVWMGSNHDLGRFPSRWCGGDERKTRLALLVLATLPGTSVLYYGDEIGMTDVEVPVALRRDNATLDVAAGADRDRARTPMPWDGSPRGGFTAPEVTPWLPVADPPAATVADQRDDPDSVLSLCRNLLVLRQAEHGGSLAEFENLTVDDGRWAYRAGPLVVTANFSDRPRCPRATCC